MERQNYINNKNILIVVYVMYAVGIIGHLITPIRSYMLLLTPFTLFFLGALVVSIEFFNKKFLLWLIITYFITLFLEIIGVKTGLIFSEYDYGKVLGFKVFDVPLVIGLNWVIVIWGGILISQKITTGPLLTAFSTAAIALIFDIFLEPVAIVLGYWYWNDITVPLQNYIAWFLIAFLFSYFYSLKGIKTTSNVPTHYIIVQFFFFIILNIFLIWV